MRGSPDEQVLCEEAEAYEALVEAAVPLPIAEPPSEPIAEELALLVESEKQYGITGLVQRAQRECPAFLLTLANEWRPCMVRHFPNSTLMITGFENGIAGGMSGSPIITESGAAIGVVCLSGGGGDDLDKYTEGGPNPWLMGNLPGWLLAPLQAG
ncbi:MAG: hypothetical protein ACM3OF_11540 [Gemmatimonas sp.]